MSDIPNSTATDRESLIAWRRRPDAEALRPLIERYGAMVYASALRRTTQADRAAEVTRAVFLVLARRARKLSKNTVLAGWLFHVTALACRKLHPPRRWWNRLRRQPPVISPPPDATLWTRVAPQIDQALDRLRLALRNAVLLRVLLNRDPGSTAQILRTSERRVNKRTERGLKQLARRLRKFSSSASAETVGQACAAGAAASALPEGFAEEILQGIAATLGRRPAFPLARRMLNTLAWRRWRRRFVVGVPISAVALGLLLGLGWYIDSLTGHSRLISTFIVWSVRLGSMKIAEPARPWPDPAAQPAPQLPDARYVRNASDLYQTTNIWLGHLRFTREQWRALDPISIGPMPNFIRKEGLILLRNPRANHSGLLGVLGYEHGWTHADFELGGLAFTNVAARAKGNVSSLPAPKHPFKVDLNGFNKGQKLGGLDELTFNNLFFDYSCLGEALAFEFFRDTGAPASRTAYAWLKADVEQQWTNRPLGLYLMIEPVNNDFAAARFGSRKTPVFKPVTYDLFSYLGEDWTNYAGIYDLKTKATTAQQRRIIDFAKLVTSGTDSEFAAHVGEFLDLDEFARFLAGQVLLSNYDGILTDGQNYYMYLDPRSNKFGFIPWDLDACWGGFWIGSKEDEERASIWHPWVGKNRLIERVLKVPEFKEIYRTHLDDFVTRLFTPARLNGRIDELAALIKGPVAAESAFRLNKFEQAVGMKPVTPSRGESAFGVNHPAHDLKHFITRRAASVRRQLDGKSRGVILKAPRDK